MLPGKVFVPNLSSIRTCLYRSVSRRAAAAIGDLHRAHMLPRSFGIIRANAKLYGVVDDIAEDHPDVFR